GIQNFLMKPINQSLLFDTIVNMFEMDKTGMTIQSSACPINGTEEYRVDGVHILLVEDNVINQEVATEILGSAGALVEIANNGQEAIDAVASKPYDLVLMDLQMPVMGGYEATKHIRAERKNQKLPIIAMTAHAMQGVEAECKAAGMNDYVSKPIDPQNLFSTILKWVKPKPAASGAAGETPQKRSDNTTAESKLPVQIPGIDMDKGLSRVGGNTKLYLKLLNDYATGYRSFIDDIRAAISEQRLEEARRLAHTLKGVSGNISANEVFSISEQLEKALTATPPEECSQLLEKLSTALHSVIDAIDAVHEDNKEDDAGKQGLATVAEIEPILQQAAQKIWTDDVDADQAIADLKQALGTRFESEMREIEKSVDGFDFEAAKEPIRKIAAELNIGLDGMDHE
ncbi:MAG: hypothetical protein CVU95_16130, partial [Firmicutes bacterium HGW-Firmicutes-2]